MRTNLADFFNNNVVLNNGNESVAGCRQRQDASLEQLMVLLGYYTNKSDKIVVRNGHKVSKDNKSSTRCDARACGSYLQPAQVASW